MPTPEQATVFFECIAAGLVLIAVGKIVIAIIAALGRAFAAMFIAIKGVLVTALVGGIVVVIATVALMGTGVVAMPTNQIAPTATPAPRPTAVRVEKLDVELERMSILKAQRYGVGYRFINDADNGVCVLQAQKGQEWLVANCD
jgi:hypothetical protein